MTTQLQADLVPEIRIRPIQGTSPNRDGDFVVYWMTAFRRLNHNFALQRSVEWANRLNKPLIILEAVRVGYQWASDRFHQFIVDGMIDNATAAKESNATYLAYVEPKRGDGHGLMESLASIACLIVTDDFPCFFHPKLYERIVPRWKCMVELVDSNGILPMRSADRTFTVAHSYRRYMQKEFAHAMPSFPSVHPLDELQVPALSSLPESIRKWNFLDVEGLKSTSMASIPIDHSVLPVTIRGGSVSARECLSSFLSSKLDSYSEARNQPDQNGSSNLSSYLHFGHISPNQMFEGIAKSAQWHWSKLSKPNGSMTGFWNMPASCEAFIDQLLTWRELGFNMCHREADYDRYDALPAWAIETLEKHLNDPRPVVYDLHEFENSKTHDELWNAAQRQLVRDGRIHNYLRMLWGKKILHWTRTPREALDTMIELNNKYALDGRDPNSYSGIFWILGRYDRAWGPERPIFGKIRYMTSESTRTKFSVKQYLAKYA